MNAVLAIAVKDLRLLSRDKGDVFFTFVFPVILAILFGFIFGGGGARGRMELALVVESDSKMAANLARDLEADASFDVTRFDSRDTAVAAVRSGKMTAAVVLPASMQEGVDNLFSGQGIPIEAVVDPARRAEAGLIEGKLNELAFRQFPTLLGSPEGNEKLFANARRSIVASRDLSPAQRLAASALVAAGESFTKSLGGSASDAAGGGSTDSAGESPAQARAWSPIAVTIEELPPRKGVPRSAFDVTFPQGVVWGLAGCVAAFAASIVSERTRGTLDRLRLAPIGRAHLLAGKGVACFVAALLVQVLLVMLAVVAFGSSIAQPAMLVVASIASAFAFSGLAMALAGLCRTEAEANGAGRGAVLILALIGGGTIPLFFMPALLRTLSFGSPFRWSVVAIEGAFWRDLPLAEQMLPLVVLAAIGVAGFLVGCRGIGRPLAR